MVKLFIRNKFVEVVNFFYSGVTDLKFNALSLTCVIAFISVGVVMDLIFGLIKHGLHWWELLLGYAATGFFTTIIIGMTGVAIWVIYIGLRLMYSEFKRVLTDNYKLASAGIKVKYAWKK